MAVDTLDFLQDIRICRAECVMIDLPRMNPLDVIMLQGLGESLRNSTVKQGQPNQNIRIFVDHLCEDISYGHGDVQFFPALPNECLFPTLTGFYLSTDKFPK